MKHVFSITSHLTFSIMLRIVETNAIDKKDCVLFLLRDYHVPESHNAEFPLLISTSYNVDVDHGRVFAGIRFGQTRRNIRRFDELVDNVLKGEEFIFYTSVCSNDICSLMVTKPNCKGFYITEDGLPSYRHSNPQTFTGVRYILYRLVLRPLWPRIFEAKNHFIEDRHPKYRGCKGAMENSFPLQRDKLQVVGFPFEKNDYGFHPDAVISVDPLYESMGMERVDRLYRELAEFIEKNQRYNNIMYKLHPRFNAAINRGRRDEFVALLKRYFPQIGELPAGVVLESMLYATKADLYCGNSALALYASQVGVRCYNMVTMLSDIPGFEVAEALKDKTLRIQP